MEDWRKICNFVTQEMRGHTRQFVTPLMHNKSLEGSGTYVTLNGSVSILTCEHVARRSPLDYRFFGSNKTLNNHDQWTIDKNADLAIASLLFDQWTDVSHHASCIPMARFAKSHAPIDCHEILFFRGYAYENESRILIPSEQNSTAYSSQEKKQSGSADHFEMFWDPSKTEYTAETTDEERAKVKYEKPNGFSGSLVWNTRYREVTAEKRNWTPAEAVVTGMVQKWDKDTKTLLVYRVEHIRSFFDSHCATLT